MMFKYALLCFLLCPFVVQSQHQFDPENGEAFSSWNWLDGPRIGILAGPNLNYASKVFNNARPKNIDIISDPEVSFQLAAALYYPASERFSLEGRVGLMHSSIDATRSIRGARSFLLSRTTTPFTQNDTFQVSSTWLELPLIGRWRPYKQSTFYFEFGVSRLFPITTTGSYAAEYCCLNRTPPEDYNSGEISNTTRGKIHLGLGFYIANNILISASWSRLEVNKDTDPGAFPIITFPVTQARIDVGWYFD